MSTILSRGYAFHVEHLAYLDNVCEHQRLLLFRLVNNINREQDLAAPMVISYLMGWGNTYCSHHYVPIYWTSFVVVLLKAFPELHQVRREEEFETSTSLARDENVPVKGEASPTAATLPANDEKQSDADEDSANVVTLGLDPTGQLYTKGQVIDYELHGEQLADYALLDFFVNTYEEQISHHCSKTTEGVEILDMSDIHCKPGRRSNNRVQYLSSHLAYKQTQRVVQSKGHNTLPNFIGRYFPRRDDPETHALFCASMLILLKPWRHVRTDLKDPGQTWKDAFESFMQSASKWHHNIVSGTQYFHKCALAARRARTDEDGILETGYRGVDRSANENQGVDLGEDAPLEIEYTEEGLQLLLAGHLPIKEELHGRHALEQARQAKIFKDDDSMWALNAEGPVIGNTSGDDLQRCLQWKGQMDKEVNTWNLGVDVLAPTETVQAPTVGRLDPLPQTDTSTEVTRILSNVTLAGEAALPGGDASQLKPDQLRTYEIVTWHLNQTLSGNKPPPLRMIIHGEGGTGKSKVIQTITEYFAQHGARHLLIKAAYTGVAASLIDGKTTHTIGMMSPKSMDTISSASKTKLEAFWKHYTYLVIDEISMIRKSFFAHLSKRISIGKGPGSQRNGTESFGGINVILCGDFHQFPPVATGPREALYHPGSLAIDSTEMQLGRSIYEEFTTVVILLEQVRVTDPVWRDFLVHLRHGQILP
ncbi:hypothetical protein EW026_g3885 [Hermanssonia centrifuga]|uniref:ATP-dependent DNA helicase n=1 Tax=Hermanssonia centrifuga TaxID=98765 RepID=A0A4V3XAI8_9APHY|nr:hypothetical protein EW026_g3885 [Hermanssonia centrifuga]